MPIDNKNKEHKRIRELRTTFKNRSKELEGYMRVLMDDIGLSYNQAVAALANVFRETSYKPEVMRGEEGFAYGAYQYDNKNAYFRFADEAKLPRNDFRTQSLYMFGDYGKYRPGYKKWMASRDAPVEELAHSFMYDFESPRDRNLPWYQMLNKDYATTLYDHFREYSTDFHNQYSDDKGSRPAISGYDDVSYPMRVKRPEELPSFNMDVPLPETKYLQKVITPAKDPLYDPLTLWNTITNAGIKGSSDAHKLKALKHSPLDNIFRSGGKLTLEQKIKEVQKKYQKAAAKRAPYTGPFIARQDATRTNYDDRARLSAYAKYTPVIMTPPYGRYGSAVVQEMNPHTLEIRSRVRPTRDVASPDGITGTTPYDLTIGGTELSSNGYTVRDYSKAKHEYDKEYAAAAQEYALELLRDNREALMKAKDKNSFLSMYKKILEDGGMSLDMNTLDGAQNAAIVSAILKDTEAQNKYGYRLYGDQPLRRAGTAIANDALTLGRNLFNTVGSAAAVASPFTGGSTLPAAGTMFKIGAGLDAAKHGLSAINSAVDKDYVGAGLSTLDAGMSGLYGKFAKQFPTKAMLYEGIGNVTSNPNTPAGLTTALNVGMAGHVLGKSPYTLGKVVVNSFRGKPSPVVSPAIRTILGTSFLNDAVNTQGYDNSYDLGGTIGTVASGFTGILGAGMQNSAIKDTSEQQSIIDQRTAAPISAGSNVDLLNQWGNYSDMKHVNYKDLLNGNDVGNTLNGIVSGATSGASLGGGIGAIVGGGLGLISGITGSIAARNKAKREAALLNKKIDASNAMMQSKFASKANSLESSMDDMLARNFW